MKFEKNNLKYLTFILYLLLNVQQNFAVNTEAVYLQTDREVYVAGESLFYKLYIVNPNTKTYSSVSKTGYITLQNVRNDNVLKIRILIDGGASSGSILLPDTLSSGVYQLVAFSNLMRNYNINSLFTKEIIITNRYDKEFNYKLPRYSSGFTEMYNSSEIYINKECFSPREKVVLNLGKNKGNLAVSVYEDPQIKLNNKNIVETFSEIVSDTIVNKPIKYLVEDKAPVLTAKVIDENSGNPLKNVNVLLTTPDTVPNLQYQTTDSTGSFHMLLSSYYDGKELYFNVDGLDKQTRYKLIFDNKYNIERKWNPELEVFNDESKYFSTSSKLFYINKYYSVIDNKANKPSKKTKFICPRLYNCDVTTVFPADFVQLKDFREIISELLPRVKLVNSNGVYGIYIINSVSSLPFQNQPAIFVDGVLIDNVGYIMDMGSEDINRIDIVDSERVYGNLVFQGVLSIITNSKRKLKEIPYLTKNKIINDTVNYGESFKITNEETNRNLKTPQLKQLLCWNPNVFSGDSDVVIEFFTSDYLSSYIIKIEGLTENGTPFYAIRTLKVEKNKDTK